MDADATTYRTSNHLIDQLAKGLGATDTKGLGANQLAKGLIALLLNCY
jgi:hypothetical protein